MSFPVGSGQSPGQKHIFSVGLFEAQWMNVVSPNIVIFLLSKIWKLKQMRIRI